MAVSVGVATLFTVVVASCVGLGARTAVVPAGRRVTVEPGIWTFTIGRIVLVVVVTPANCLNVTFKGEGTIQVANLKWVGSNRSCLYP